MGNLPKQIPIGDNGNDHTEDSVAERHRISKHRLEATRAMAAERRKRRRLSAPATMHNPGGKVVARRTRREALTVTDSERKTDTPTTRRGRSLNLPKSLPTCAAEADARLPPSTFVLPASSRVPTTPPRSRRMDTNLPTAESNASPQTNASPRTLPMTAPMTRVNDSLFNTARPDANSNKVHAEQLNLTNVDSQATVSASLLSPKHSPPQGPKCDYAEHGIDEITLSIDDSAGTPLDEVGDLRHMFKECDIGEESDDFGAGVPSMALAASLDFDEWETNEGPPETHHTVMNQEQPPSVERPTAGVPNVFPLVDRRLTDNFLHSPALLDVDAITNRMKAVLTWEKLVSYMAICGRAPFCAERYAILRGVVAALPGDHRLHEYKTVRRQMMKNLSAWCFPKSQVYFVSNISCPRGTSVIKTIGTCNAGRKAVQACIRVVMPTEWAKLDIASYPFYSDVFEHPGRGNEETLSIERAPIVQRRSSFIGREPKLWVWFQGVPVIASTRDVVSVPCAAKPQQVDSSRKVRSEWFSDPTNCNRTNTDTQVRAVVCGLWNVGKVPHPGERRPPGPQAPTDAERWTDHELAIFMKFSVPSPNSDALEIVLENNATEPNKRLVGKTPVHNQTRLGYSTNVIDLNPGDQCVLLRSQTVDESRRVVSSGWKEEEKTQHCLLIGSLVRQGLGLSAERLVWIDVEKMEEEKAIVRYVGSANVIDMPTWLDGDSCTPWSCYDGGHERNTGRMADGTRYVVYRFALYMDGFQQTKSMRDKRSIGGCYLMPLGLSLDARRGTGAPHVITLASSSLSHNKVLDIVMENISRAAHTGVDGVDPYGRRVRIFLDPVSFFGDYPAAALCADTVGHIGNAFCTHCSVRKRRSPTTSRILGMSTNHCRRTGFMRTDARMDAIRESPLKPAILKSIGMKSRDKESGSRLPLVRLSKLCRSASPERNDRDEVIVPVMFESSLSCAAVPDHLFNGLIKNTLNVVFEALPDNTKRKRVERRVMSMLQENGLPVTGHLLKWGSRKEYKGLHGQTMTGFMCILLCSATAFEDVYIESKDDVFHLVRCLQVFLSAVYFWPSRRLDGDRHVEMFTTEGKMRYYKRLIMLCEDYLAACEAVMTVDERAGAVLDKPNAHRALELVMHTIPAFGHARNCSEMVLELMHQVFKQWLEKNTHQDSHITAVERALAKDWLGRAFALYSVWKNGNSHERACSEVGLRRLFLGEEGMIFDERQPGITALRELFQSCLTSAIRKPNDIFMSKCGHIRSPRAQKAVWIVTAAKKIPPGKEDTTIEASAGLKLIESYYNLRIGWGRRECEQYSAARLRVFDMYENNSTSYKYNEVEVGQVVSVVCDSSDVIVRDTTHPSGELHFFAVNKIFGMSRDKKLWSVCRPMIGEEKFGRIEYCVSASKLVILEMGCGVRRAGAAHICDEECHAPRGSQFVVHSRGVLDGGRYELWSRKDGYPPYMG